ncbi:MAG: methyltransferase [Chitinophagaceae bacterium]|nr:methyltransferase [Chitinophagaceae bacterium]
MPNSYFQFKQFTVYQDKCAMKVSTDACILGAWFAAKIRDYTYILDIGSGTGLLMLMLAQKLKSQIHGIELDPDCFKQLKDNIGHNNWKDKCRIFIGDARTFVFPVKYDFVITNPPFYENQLPSDDERKNLAKHSSNLSLQELLDTTYTNLAEDGSLGILLPSQRVKPFRQMAEKKGFCLSEELQVKQTTQHDYFRSVLHFTKNKVSPVQSYSLAIKEKDEYTAEFTELLKDYYLKL